MATPTKPQRRARVVTGSAKAAQGSASFLDERLGLARWLRPNLRKLFPSHWSFLLGEFALYSFVVLVLTGTFLTLFYKPNPDVAFTSVREISLDVRGGLLIRQMHHWAATIFVLSIVAHLFRVFFTAAFRKPRELSWMTGVVLFGLALFESFLGVSLPADQLAMTGLREAQGLLLSTPLIGGYLSALVFNGDFPGQVIPRIFVTHVLLVPGILLALIPLHGIVLTWRQKHTDHRTPTSDESRVTGGPFFPYFIVKNGATTMFTMAVVAVLATFVRVNPVWEHGPYQPGNWPPSAQPFWYYGVLEGALRLTPPWVITVGGVPLQVGLWIPMLVLTAFFTILFLYPFLERRFTKDRRVHNLLDRPSHAPVRTALGAAVITFFTVLWAGTWVSETPPDPNAPVPLLTAPHETYVWIVYGLRIAIFVLPPIVYAITLAVCRSRARR
ncbi:cytochrome b [Nonomuraea guangzhouensis]|uniref:Cytochrome bc complex cytochrome b subunit n=1 Tax=Nonomuraea guangzhouensis TaxID=1291555 RepID=A0ABW4G9D7_9ACTN|nr:cytochrome bc complex cytochrome b subunit [Nonomuraea guangzhouensis]